MFEQVRIFQHPPLAVPIFADPVILNVRLAQVRGKPVADSRWKTLLAQHRAEQARKVAAVDNHFFLARAVNGQRLRIVLLDQRQQVVCRPALDLVGAACQPVGVILPDLPDVDQNMLHDLVEGG